MGIKMYNGVWGVEDDTPIEGAEIMFKNVEGGVQIDYDGLTLDLILNKETTSTDWTDGADIGVEEIQDITFLPTGVAISGSVMKPSEFKRAIKSEFWERVDEEGNAKPLALGWI